MTLLFAAGAGALLFLAGRALASSASSSSSSPATHAVLHQGPQPAKAKELSPKPPAKLIITTDPPSPPAPKPAAKAAPKPAAPRPLPMKLPASLPRTTVDRGTERERTIVDTSSITKKPGTKVIELPKTVITAPAPKTAAKPAAKPPATKPTTATPARTLNTQQRASAAKVATAKETKGASTVQNTAAVLEAYLVAGNRERARVADWQWTLGVDADGVPGPRTYDAVKAALGRTPKFAALNAAQMKGAVPGGATPLEAAQRLERYIGLGGKQKERIAAYQRALGVAADGLMGPKTRAAADKALGRAGRW